MGEVVLGREVWEVVWGREVGVERRSSIVISLGCMVKTYRIDSVILIFFVLVVAVITNKKLCRNA